MAKYGPDRIMSFKELNDFGKMSRGPYCCFFTLHYLPVWEFFRGLPTLQ